MKDSSLLTVTFQIPSEAKGQLLNIRKKLSETYVTKDDLPDPHITIYQCKIPKEYVQQAISDIEVLARRYVGFQFNPIGLNIKNEYVGIKYQKTSELELFHEQVIGALNVLRSGLIRSIYIERCELYSLEEQKYIDQYGYPYIFELYEPHVALVAFVNKADTSLVGPDIVPTRSLTSINMEIIIVNDGEKTIKPIAFGAETSSVL